MKARTGGGFTLIELMVTITILGILVMLALPSYSQWISNTQVRNQAESIQNGLRVAQREAAARNGSVSFILTNASPPTCSSTAEISGVNWAVCSGSVLIQQSTGKSGSATAKVTSGFSSVGFDGLGRTNLGTSSTVKVTSTRGDCEKADADGIRCLNVQLTTGGKVRLCDPLLPDGDPSACN